MFSFWSNDDEENINCSDESDDEKEKSIRPERFRYVGNNKKGECANAETSNPLTCGDVFQNSYNVNVFNQRKKKMDDMLQDVWSVRKDVRINTNTVKASEIGTKSYYSRHGGVSGVGTHTDSLNEKNALTGGAPIAKTWSVPRTTYSYSDNSVINQYDILDDNTMCNTISPSGPSCHNEEVHQQNIVNSLNHDMVTGPNRELSARTRRAQKFNNAYLRSTGLGKYTPGLTKPLEQHKNPSDNKWKR